MSTLETIPARMSFEDVARRAAESRMRFEQMRASEAEQRAEMSGPWSATDPALAAAMGGGSLNRLVLDWVSTCMSPDDEVRGSTRRWRGRARELERTNSYAASYLNLLGSNVIGPTGFAHKALVRNNDDKLAAGINARLEDGFAEWCEAASLDGQWSLTELSHQQIKTVARDGEGFVRLWRGPAHPDGLALEPIDPDLVDEGANQSPDRNGNGEIRSGVIVDQYGRRTGFVTYPKLYTERRSSERVVIPASEMLHLYRARRVNQTRGISWFGPAMIALKMLDGYEEAELVAARISAAKMGFFEAKTDEPPEVFNPNADARRPFTMEANPGTAETLPVGWTFKEWSPDHPATAFPAFVKNILRKVATALGVSYNALASDLEGVNYSSMRSGLLVERDTWRVLQAWWTSKFLRRVYREWVRMAMLSGRITLDGRDPSRYYDCAFIPRGYPWVDPLKEVQAAKLAIDSGLDSRTRIVGERGEEFADIVEEIAAEEELAKEKGVELHRDVAAAKPAASDDENDDTPDETANTIRVGQNGHKPRAEVARALRRSGIRGGR